MTGPSTIAGGDWSIGDWSIFGGAAYWQVYAGANIGKFILKVYLISERGNLPNKWLIFAGEWHILPNS
jgi:hypothetical protein